MPPYTRGARHDLLVAVTDVFRRKAALERDLAAVDAEELHLVTALDDLGIDRLDTAYAAARGYYDATVPLDVVKRLRGAIGKRAQRARTGVRERFADPIAFDAPRSQSGTEEDTMNKSRLRRRTVTTTEEWAEDCEGSPCPPGLSDVEAADDEHDDHEALHDVEGDDDEAA